VGSMGFGFLALKYRTLYSKREKFCSLWLILQNYQMMSYSRRLTKLFISHLSLLQLFGCFIRMTNSYGLSLRGDVFYSYNRLLFWACMLPVTCLCVPFERPFGESMSRKCCHHDEATMGSMPSCHFLGIGCHIDIL
jgi:hypothetical protein